jgi:hypothetical protein
VIISALTEGRLISVEFACKPACMSTKTIALESQVYEKLAAHKGGGESFTKVIDRLVESQCGETTCADAVRQAAALWAHRPSAQEVKAMEAVVGFHRRMR